MARICFICQRGVPEGSGTYFSSLRILACNGKCDRLVLDASKDFAKSRRGRLRTKSEWLNAIEQAKAALPVVVKKEPCRVHIRWMIRRDMDEVFQIESSRNSDPWSEEEFLQVLRQRNAIGVVAEHGEKVVGFHIYELRKHSLRIVNFSVHPNWRRRGIGTALVEQWKSKLSSHRRTSLVVDVPEENLEMLLFLKRFGFRAKPMLHGDTEITMVFRLRQESPEEPANRIAAYLDGAET